MQVLQILPQLSPDQLLWWLIILIIIGIVAIVVIGFLFAFPIAGLAAILVWFVTGGDLFLTGLTFLIVALLSAAIGRIWRATYRERHDHVHRPHSEHSEPTHGEPVHEGEHGHEHEHTD